MHITQLQLRDYRNFEELLFRPEQGLTVIAGDNAQGKTNLVEAIWLCCTGRSHRTLHDRELVRFTQPQAYIASAVTRRDGEHRIELLLQAGGKRALRVNGLPARRMGELMGHALAVMFSPEDLQLVRGSAGRRRRFLDVQLSQTDRVFFYDLQTYLKALQQRNALLKNLPQQKELADTLDVWDVQLAQSGAKVSLKRRAFQQALQPLAAEKHATLAKGSALAVDFVGCISAQTEQQATQELLEKLQHSRKSDLRLGQTTVGPHREDLRFTVDGADLRTYGSQGQVRTAALALKLAEIEWMGLQCGEPPMLILDDVLSELDQSRRDGLLQAVGGVQTFLTCARPEADLGGVCTYFMQDGRLQKR